MAIKKSESKYERRLTQITRTKATTFKSTGQFVFKGVIKNGLDTSRLVNLIVCFESPEEYRMPGFPLPPNFFYIHHISISETLGILIHKFGMDAETRMRKIQNWIKNFHLKIIYQDEIAQSYEEVVRKANEIVVKRNGEKLKIGEMDTIIIAGFLKEKINIIHVRDKGFAETCKELGLNVIPTPQQDTDKENLKRRRSE